MRANQLTIARLVCSLLFWVWAMVVVAQSTRIEKEYDETFPALDGGELHITNKYGEVIINTWELDSVQVLASVVSQGQDTDDVQESVDRIVISFRHTGKIISAVTSVNSSSRGGLFKELISEVEKGISNNNEVRVNYEVWLPADFAIYIDNKYGNVFLSDYAGRLGLNLSHGDFKAQHLTGTLNLEHSYGKHVIDYVSNAEFTLRGVESDVRAADLLKVQSSSSELSFGVVNGLFLKSRNDEVYVEQSKRIVADGSFSDVVMDQLVSQAHLDFNYGDIYVKRIARDFESIDILGKSADVNLVLDQGSYVQTEIKGDQDKMIVPNSMLTLSKGADPNTSQIILSGYVGNTHKNFSKLNINCDGGELVIAIKELPLYSEKD